MNSDTLQTLLRLLIKMVAGYLVGKGLIDSHSVTDNAVQEIAGVVLGILGLVLSRFHQQTIAAKGQTQFLTKSGPTLILIGLLLPVILVATPGCKTSPLTVAYRSAAAGKLTATAAMSAFLDYAEQGHVTRAQFAQAQSLYARYVQAMTTARDAAVAYAGAVAGNPGSPPSTAQLDGLIAAVAVAGDDVVSFVTSTIPKP